MTTVDPTTHDPNSSSTAPAQIYIIRHGEKPADLAPPAPNQPPPVPGPPFGVDFDGNQDIHSLLPRGWQRSGALTVLFAPAVGALRPGIRTPGALFSPSYGDPAKTQSHRTYETIYGLSQRSGAPINSPVQEGQEPALAAVVLKGPAPGRAHLLGTPAHSCAGTGIANRAGYDGPGSLARRPVRRDLVLYGCERVARCPVHVQPDPTTAFGRRHGHGDLLKSGLDQ